MENNGVIIKEKIDIPYNIDNLCRAIVVMKQSMSDASFSVEELSAAFERLNYPTSAANIENNK